MKQENWISDSRIDRNLKEYLLDMAMEILGSIIILDDQCRLVYINDRYAQTMGIDVQECLGKEISEVIPGTGMPQVMKYGVPDIGSLFCRNGNEYLVNRFPIYRNGKIIGTIGQATDGELNAVLQLKSQIHSITRSLNYYRNKSKNLITAKYSLDHIITQDPTMKELKEVAKEIARTASPVLISGESGTGKELFAHAIHAMSPRSSHPFIRLDCGALTDRMLEKELFGDPNRSSANNALEEISGDLEMADGGTLLLDRIDAMSLDLQARLVGVIRDKVLHRDGEKDPTRVDIRFVFTTDKDLYRAVQEGLFRKDLYYWIHVVNLRMLPLRQRPADIRVLADTLIKKLNKESEKNITGISSEAFELLRMHSWPGNVRELNHALEIAYNHAATGVLEEEHFDHLEKPAPTLEVPPRRPRQPETLRQIRDRAEREAILTALVQTDGNRMEAARLLDINRSALYQKLRKYGLET